MTANPYIIDRRAKSVQDLQATFEIIDAKRWEWAAGVLAEAGRASAAELAASFAAEHRTVAATLNGERAVGDEEERSALMTFMSAPFACDEDNAGGAA